MKNITFWLLLFANVLYGQRSSFAATYAATYKIDGKSYKEQIILLLNPKENTNYCLSSALYVKDSLEANKNFVQNLENIQKYDALFKPKVLYKNGVASTFETLGGATYYYDEIPDIKWTLGKDKEKTENMTGRNATCTMFGRRWTAWYTSDIPINAGPYKFSGLPGFIYRLYSEDGAFSYELVQFKKTARKFYLPKNARKIAKAKVAGLRYSTYVTGIIAVESFQNADERNREIRQLERYYKTFPYIE